MFLYHVDDNKNIKEMIIMLGYNNFYAGDPWDKKMILRVPYGQNSWETLI